MFEVYFIYLMTDQPVCLQRFLDQNCGLKVETDCEIVVRNMFSLLNYSSNAI